ncbi:hypothetical protein FOZ60_017151, partial [Perkinsus olseni]
MAVAPEWHKKMAEQQSSGLDLKASVGWLATANVPLQIEADIIALRTLSIATRAYPVEQDDPILFILPRKLEYYRPDIIAAIKSRRLVLVIEIAVCADHSVVKKEGEKRSNVKLVPVVIGVTGAVTKSLPRMLKDAFLGDVDIRTCQRVA